MTSGHRRRRRKQRVLLDIIRVNSRIRGTHIRPRMARNHARISPVSIRRQKTAPHARQGRSRAPREERARVGVAAYRRGGGNLLAAGVLAHRAWAGVGGRRIRKSQIPAT